MEMDAYEATRVVFSRIQSLDPENAAKIMGLLLIQDHGEEMTRLAFGPEALLQNVVAGARKELGLHPPSSPLVASSTSSNSAAAAAAAAVNASSSSFLLGRQNSSSRLLGGGGGGLVPLTVSSPTSWAPPPVFSRSSSSISNGRDDLQGSQEELVSPNNPNASPLYGAGFSGGNDLIDELQLPEQLSFLNDSTSNSGHGLQIPQKGDFFYTEMPGDSRSHGDIDGAGMFSYGMGGWGGHHRRSCSAADMNLGSDVATAGFGWKPCLYFARGFCKNGTSCRFLHGLPDDSALATMFAGSKMDAATSVEQQFQEFLLRSKSQRQMMASAFPYSPTGSLPSSPSGVNKCINFLLQQQNESQRSAVAAAAALMLGGSDDSHKFLSRSRMMERNDFASVMSNPGSRQIYLTFPADSTFKEEDVSNYFSIYGPVQDVRIPYQQKRMFGFVTFVYPETVKLILAKGNPHFVCDARVLVKPYKEKGKVPDKYRKQQQQAERVEFSSCTSPTGLDLRDNFELPQLGGKMFYNNSISQETLLKRKLEEQQEAAELQHAIELQSRRLMGLQLLELKSRNHFSSNTYTPSTSISSPTTAMSPPVHGQESNISRAEDKNSNPATVIASATTPAETAEPQVKTFQQSTVNAAATVAVEEESSAGEATPEEVICSQESNLDHNLPDSPFASPTKASSFPGDSFSSSLMTKEVNSDASAPPSGGNHLVGSTLFPSTSTFDIASFNPCFFQMPRFSSDHGAVGM